ncbi:hypothetical protein ACVU7I_18740, partial [Patulibacter sp. S7RM1-6]
MDASDRPEPAASVRRPPRSTGRGDHAVAGQASLLAGGRVRLLIGPVGDLAQLDDLIVGLGATDGIVAVHVERVEDAWVALLVDLRRAVPLPDHLRRLLGARLTSCRPEEGTLVARLATPGPAVPIPPLLHGLQAAFSAAEAADADAPS